MKKKLILAIMLICTIFITGCGKDSNNIKGSSKENKHISDFIINNLVDNNPKSNRNQFYVFNSNGKFIYTNSTAIGFKRPKIVLFIKGTWTLEKNNLILKQEEVVYQSLDATRTKYELEQATIDKTLEFKNLVIDKNSAGEQFLKGDKCRILKKTNDNKEYVKKVKYYLEHDFEDIDLEELKKIEAK